MKSDELLALLEKVGPLSLSDEYCKKYEAYDNSGLIVDCNEEIKGVLFSLDLSQRSVDEAIKRGYNAIVTHHPAIFDAISSLSAKDFQAVLVAKCFVYGITIISMHLNFDVAPKGIDYFLMRGLGGTEAELNLTLDGGAYGRCYNIEPQRFGDYVERVKKTFKSDRVIFYGDPNRTIGKVASFCGSGCNNDSVKFAIEKKADVFVSSDFKHHHLANLCMHNISVIALTHYAAETYGFSHIYSKIKKELNIPSAYFCDEELI